MTANVVKFYKKDDKPVHEQTAAGEAFCLQCRHEWVQVAPTGTTRFECPKCLTMKGLFKFEHGPNDNELRRECHCGNQLFYLTPEGHMCANCGIYQSY
jgi:hypothetical protein